MGVEVEVWMAGGVGGGKIYDIHIIRLFLIDYGEILHACSKAFV